MNSFGAVTAVNCYYTAIYWAQTLSPRRFASHAAHGVRLTQRLLRNIYDCLSAGDGVRVLTEFGCFASFDKLRDYFQSIAFFFPSDSKNRTIVMNPIPVLQAAATVYTQFPAARLVVHSLWVGVENDALSSDEIYSVAS